MQKLMKFENNQIEIIELNGKIYFNAKHVGNILGIKNVNDNISRMNEKQVVKLTNDSVIGKTDTRKFNNFGENFLSESGVYKLILRSNKPAAERFQDWVTDEVLPSLKSKGSYSLFVSNNELLKTLESKLKELDEKVAQLDNYYRPTHKEKISISNYIKKRIGADAKSEEYQLVIERIMICFGVQRWQDIPLDSLRVNMNIIDESIEAIHRNNENSIRFFED